MAPLPNAARARPNVRPSSYRRAGTSPSDFDAAVTAAPPRAGLWATAVYAAMTLLLGWPALAGKFLVGSHSDQYIAGYGFREFAASWMRQTGGFPLWTPYQFGGMPYVAAMHGDTFYPTFLLRAFLPTDVAMTWGFMIHVFLAGSFTYLLLRRALGLGFYGALIGGLAYMAGGNVAGLVSPGHDGKLYLAALLPLLLTLVHAGIRGGRAWAWGTLAIATTLAILTPHPQLLQYLLLVAGAYALFLAFSADVNGERLARRTAFTRLGLATIAIGVGFVGSAIQYWPVLQYTAWSPRAGGLGWEHAISYSMPPEELLDTYLPQFSGILTKYWGRNGIHFHSEYIGASVLVLAGTAYFGRAAMRKHLWFWTGVAIVATLWALGGYTPFFSLVYAIVPGTKFFKAPSTMLYVVAFSVCTLAAIGVDALIDHVRNATRYAFAAIGVALVVAILATAGAFTNLGVALVGPERGVLVDANAAAVTIGAWRSFVAVAAVAAVLVLVARGRMRASQAGAVVAAVVALDLYSIERQYWQFSPPAKLIYASDPVIEYLRTVTDSGRVMPLDLQPLARTEGLRDPYFGTSPANGYSASGLMVHRVRTLAGYHGNELGRYDQLTGWGSDEFLNRLANPNVWRLTNLRYLLTNTPDVPIQGATRVAGPARDVVGTMTYLYRLPGDNPPVWVAPLAVKAPDDNVLATVLDPRFDVRRAALFDTAATVPTQSVPPQLPAPLDLTARITRRTADGIDVALSAPAPAGAAMVLSENYYPGWVARVGGTQVPVGRADYTLIGVSLPAGAREVSLQFTSPRYETGRMLTLVALLGSTVAAVGGVLLERRRRAAAA